MTIEELLSKSINLAIEANKKLAKKTGICLHDLYSDAVEMAESIKIHAVKGVFPDKLFKHRSPNETAKESEYIRNNYKQLTLPVFSDYIATIGRPMGDGNWSIDYKEDSSEYKTAKKTFQQYVEYELPIYGSVETFVKFILPSIKSIDANGFTTVRPKSLPYTESEEGKVIDANTLYEPTIFFFESKDVISYEENKYYLFLGKDKSIVTFNGKEVKEGNVYELYAENAIYFVIQYGLKSDNNFRVELFYEHNKNKCYVHQLMGVPHLKDGKILWQSPFLYACDLLDLVAMNGNWEQAMINKCVYPVTVMFGSVCEFRDSYGNICNNGHINHEGKESDCPSCSGTGLKSRLSPLGTLLINPTTKFEQGEEKASQDPLRFISPEVHTLDFIHKKIESDTMKARSILKLRNKNTSVTTNDGVMTATEVFDDAKGLQAFVMPISNQIFYLYDFYLKAIGEQRYDDGELAVLNYAKTCDFKTPEDYLNEISKSHENNLPPSFVQATLINYVNAYYGDNSKTNSIFKLVIYADRLFGLSSDEINLQLARGTVAKWEQILHSSVLSFINDSILSDATFMDKQIEDQIIILTDLAKNKQLEIEGKPLGDIATSLLPDSAANTLSESVGGLTGMIEIVKAVASGVYDLDAAIALVSQRFGISEEEARKQLGTPQIIQSEQQATKVATLT